MMKLLVWLLLALLAPSSVSPVDIGNNTVQRNDPNESADMAANKPLLTDRPLLSVAKFRQRRQVQSSPSVSDDGSNLEWVTWNNSLPNYAVSIYNGYVGRTDYVCKYMCEAGVYSPSGGPYCYYTKAKKEYPGFPFEILVNKDNFEILEWKEDSYGSVPQNSVRTCPGEGIYVGQNKYGLGKVSVNDKSFYLPWEGYEYWYRYYQVLTVSENIVSQMIYDVKYNTEESKIFQYPPEIMRKTTLSNYECNSVVKRDTLTKTHQVEQRWDFTFSIAVGVKTTFKVGVPFIVEGGVEVSTEVTFQYSQGHTVTETITDTITVEVTAPPNHACTVTMKRLKYKINIPFTARLSRTYGNGDTHTTIITGTYDSVQISEVQAVMDRCEFLNHSMPCTLNEQVMSDIMYPNV